MSEMIEYGYGKKKKTWIVLLLQFLFMLEQFKYLQCIRGISGCPRTYIATVRLCCLYMYILEDFLHWIVLLSAQCTEHVTVLVLCVHTMHIQCTNFSQGELFFILWIEIFFLRVFISPWIVTGRMKRTYFCCYFMPSLIALYSKT